MEGEQLYTRDEIEAATAEYWRRVNADRSGFREVPADANVQEVAAEQTEYLVGIIDEQRAARAQ